MRNFEEMAIKKSYNQDERFATWLLLKERVPEKELSDALTALNSTTTQVLRLHYVEGNTLREIAKMIDKSISVIRNHRNRGVFKLKRQFEEYLDAATKFHAF